MPTEGFWQRRSKQQNEEEESVKPLKIEFAAFGSYPEKVEVDFTALYDRGLFVISGDTGAGKTTVFDAMSFALFGKPPGKPADDIRSHHATDSTKTCAQFTFEAGGAVYVVRQTPRFEKLKQDGSGTTTVNRTASLKGLTAIRPFRWLIRRRT